MSTPTAPWYDLNVDAGIQPPVNLCPDGSHG